MINRKQLLLKHIKFQIQLVYMRSYTIYMTFPVEIPAEHTKKKDLPLSFQQKMKCLALELKKKKI